MPGQSTNQPDSRPSGAPGFYQVICPGSVLWLRPGSTDYRGLTPMERRIVTGQPEPSRPPPPPEPPTRTIGYVYCVQRGDAGSVKIGFTTSYQSGRIPALDTASDVELRVLAFVPGGRTLEKRLHRELAADRMRREWFHPAPEVLARIRQLT